jgi:hypothetical protein
MRGEWVRLPIKQTPLQFVGKPGRLHPLGLGIKFLCSVKTANHNCVATSLWKAGAPAILQMYAFRHTL